MRRRLALVLALVLALMLAAAAAVGPPAVSQSKTVALRIAPRLGDTLHMRFDQVVQAAGPATHVASAPTRTTSMQVRARSVVERVDASGTIVLSITDSAVFHSPGADRRQVEETRNVMRGRWARMRVGADGAMELLAPAPHGGAGARAESFATLPGTLPAEPVAVGATWTREMALPWGGTMPSDGGRLQVVFRLDSVARGGTLAFVSMHGALARAGVARRGARVETSGTMQGYLRVDLRRGWMTDSRATFAMLSTMTPAPGTAKGKPMQLRVTITQRLHCDEP